MQLINERIEAVEVFSHRLRDFFVRRRPPQLLAKLCVHSLEILAFLAKGPRGPIQIAEAIENGSAYANFGVGLELHLTLGFELVHGVKQAEHAGIDQVTDFDAAWQSRRDSMGNMSDKRKRLVD